MPSVLHAASKAWNKKLTTTEEGSRRLGIGFELGIVLVHEERNELLRDGAIQVRVGATHAGIRL